MKNELLDSSPNPTTFMTEPTAIPFFERTRLNIHKIVCSDEQSSLLTSDGKLYTWGRQYKGIDDKGRATRSKPQLIPFGEKRIKSLSMNAKTMVVLTEDNVLMGCGDQTSMEAGNENCWLETT